MESIVREVHKPLMCYWLLTCHDYERLSFWKLVAGICRANGFEMIRPRMRSKREETRQGSLESNDTHHSVPSSPCGDNRSHRRLLPLPKLSGVEEEQTHAGVFGDKQSASNVACDLVLNSGKRGAIEAPTLPPAVHVGRPASEGKSEGEPVPIASYAEQLRSRGALRGDDEEDLERQERRKLGPVDGREIAVGGMEARVVTKLEEAERLGEQLRWEQMEGRVHVLTKQLGAALQDISELRKAVSLPQVSDRTPRLLGAAPAELEGKETLPQVAEAGPSQAYSEAGPSELQADGPWHLEQGLLTSHAEGGSSPSHVGSRPEVASRLTQNLLNGGHDRMQGPVVSVDMEP